MEIQPQQMEFTKPNQIELVPVTSLIGVIKYLTRSDLREERTLRLTVLGVLPITTGRTWCQELEALLLAVEICLHSQEAGRGEWLCSLSPLSLIYSVSSQSMGW